MDLNTAGVAEYFGSIAHVYDSHTDRNEYRIPAWVEQRCSLLPKHGDMRILDLACGNGNIGVVMKRVFPQAQIIGVDLSRRMIEEAVKRDVYEKTFVHDLGQGLPSSIREGKESFDLVLAYGLMECMERPDRMLSDIAHVLKTTGTLWTGFEKVTEAIDPSKVQSAVGFRTFPRDMHEIKDLVARAGLNIVFEQDLDAYKRSFDRKVIPYIMLELTAGDIR